MTSKKIAIYALVPPEEELTHPDPERQLLVLREDARRRGYEVVGVYVDYETGPGSYRAEYQRLFENVQSRSVDGVLVWSYDRFARSLPELIHSIETLRAHEIDFLSYQEEIDTTTAQGRSFFSLVASFAKLETVLTSKRAKAVPERDNR